MNSHRFAWDRPTSGSYLPQRTPGSGSLLTTELADLRKPPVWAVVFPASFHLLPKH